MYTYVIGKMYVNLYICRAEESTVCVVVHVLDRRNWVSCICSQLPGCFEFAYIKCSDVI